MHEFGTTELDRNADNRTGGLTHFLITWVIACHTC